MLKKFKSLVKKHENESDLIEQLQKINDLVTNLIDNHKSTQNTNDFRKKYKEYVEDIENISPNIKMELLNLAHKFNFVNSEYTRLDYRINQSETYTFGEYEFGIGYNGDKEGEGSTWFHFSDTKNVKYGIPKRIFELGDHYKCNITALHEMYNSLNLKYVTIYRLFDVICSIVTPTDGCYCVDFIIYDDQIL